MKVSELKTEMDSLFAAVNERFERIDERFERVDKRFERIDERFERVDKRFEQVDGTLEELRQLIKSEGEATRRHFDVVAEKMVRERNLRWTGRWRPPNNWSA
jgi:hypothetical protein